MEKIKNILSTKAFRIFTVISTVFFGLFLRLMGIYKADGLWLDELTNYYNAKPSFPIGIIKSTYTYGNDGPLYSLILNLWMRVFGEHDLIIRFLPVLCGVLTILIVYFIGKELSSHKTGLLASFLLAINSFHIYYSQEARLFSFAVLLASLSILFLVRLKNNQSIKNYLGLFFTNLTLLFTFMTGLVFVFGELIIFCIYLFITKKEYLKKVVYLSIAQFAVFLPYLILIIEKTKNEGSLLKNFYTAGPLDFLITLQNYFSPVLTGLYGPNSSYYSNIFSSGINYFFILWALLPIAIYLIFVAKGTFKKNFVLVFSLVGILYYLVITVAESIGGIVFASRHTLLSLPVLIVAAAYGFTQFKNKISAYCLISLLIGINLFFVLFSPSSAPRMPRGEGFQAVGEVLNKSDLNNQDVIIMPYGLRYLGKYYTKSYVSKMHIFDLTLLNTIGNFVEPQYLKNLTKENCQEVLKPYIISDQPSKPFETFIEADAINKVAKGRYIAVVLAPMIQNTYNDAMLKRIANDENIYKSQPIFYYLASKTMNDLYKILYNHNFIIVSANNYNAWRVIIFKKG